MKVSEAIEKLQKLDPDLDIGSVDNESIREIVYPLQDITVESTQILEEYEYEDSFGNKVSSWRFAPEREVVVFR